MNQRAERDYIKRCNVLRRWLRKNAVAGVESVSGEGDFLIYIVTSTRQPLHIDGSFPEDAIFNTREVRVPHAPCDHCKMPWDRHAPAYGKCLFTAIEYSCRIVYYEGVDGEPT